MLSERELALARQAHPVVLDWVSARACRASVQPRVRVMKVRFDRAVPRGCSACPVSHAACGAVHPLIPLHRSHREMVAGVCRVVSRSLVAREVGELYCFFFVFKVAMRNFIFFLFLCLICSINSPSTN